MSAEYGPSGPASASTKPTEDEDGARPFDGPEVETQGSEARPEKSSVPHPVGACPESTSNIGLESVLEQILRGVPAMTLTERDCKDTNSAATTTAEILKEAAKADLLPSDPLTREHFGFNRPSAIKEESNLLGLYQGLLIHLPDPPSTKTVQLWQERNKLAGGIYYAYKTQHGRSGYFNWFQKNQHIIDASKINPQGQMGQP